MRMILLVLLLCVVGVGFYRGWFSFSSNHDAGSNKVDYSLIVDRDKAKEDVGKVNEKTTEVGNQATTK